MEASARKKVWTYEEYRRLDDDNRYAAIGGELIISPVPSSIHQRVSRDLEWIIWQFVKEKSLGEIYHAPIDVVFNEGTAEEETVQADSLFIAAANAHIIKA